MSFYKKYKIIETSKTQALQSSAGREAHELAASCAPIQAVQPDVWHAGLVWSGIGAGKRDIFGKAAPGRKENKRLAPMKHKNKFYFEFIYLKTYSSEFN